MGTRSVEAVAANRAGGDRGQNPVSAPGGWSLSEPRLQFLRTVLRP